MLKKIIKIFFIFLLFLFSKTYSDFVICDSWNINYDWVTVSEICNWWYESVDISLIESFTWGYVNYDLWFWWNDYNLNLDKNISENFPVWFFDINRKTVLNNVNPEFSSPVWFIWTAYLDTWIITDIENNFPVWFFDINKKTIILKPNPDFSFPVWYIWDYKVVKKSWWNHIIIIQDTSYRKFFEDIFKENIDPKFLWKYSKYELELFIENILNLLLESEKDKDKIISETTKNRIRLYIKNSDFNKNLNNLIKNLDLINNAFEIIKDNKQKLYVIKYYLD